MKNDNALKKHHFWLLLGFVPLFALIGMFTVSSSVGGKIDEGEKALKEAQGKLASKLNPKPKVLIQKADKLVEYVASKSGNLHKDNWEDQKNLYTWPAASPLLKEIEAKNLKFGDAMPNDRGEFEEFKRTSVYVHQFSSLAPDGSGAPGTGMADRIAPTQFLGGWKNVLRYVNDFGEKGLNKDQVWLMMEDIWVQRSLLDAVRSVNEEMSKFRRAKVVTGKDGVVDFVYDTSFDAAGNKLKTDGSGKPVADKAGQFARVPTPEDERRKAAFRNRTWGVELELTEVDTKEGRRTRLGGRLVNLSDRLQLMGVGSAMTLNVWLSRAPGAQPKVFKIGGETLAGKGATKVVRREKGEKEKGEIVDETIPAYILDVVPMEDHIIPVGMVADEIVRVEQVFDIRTVPIKRIEDLGLGKPDASKGDSAELFPPKFIKVDETQPAATQPTGTPGMPGGMDMGMPGGIGVGKDGNTGTKAGVGQRRGGGSISTVIDANKKRYIEPPTDQVRRMPIGIVLIVDQAYMQDVMMAFTNSPLRFQITQVTWMRFQPGVHTPLAGTNPSGSTGDTNIEAVGTGRVNIGGTLDPDSRGPLGKIGGMGIPMTPSVIPPGMGMPGTGVPGMPGTGPGTGTGTGTGSAVSESQITSGLVELSIYGVVSLYEKYTEPKKDEPKKDDTESKKDDGTTPKKDDGKANEVKKDDGKKDGTTPKEPKGEKPKEPAMPEGKGGTPKMRRRARK